jgi:hypothetical protein
MFLKCNTIKIIGGVKLEKKVYIIKEYWKNSFFGDLSLLVFLLTKIIYDE